MNFSDMELKLFLPIMHLLIATLLLIRRLLKKFDLETLYKDNLDIIGDEYNVEE